ncbi:MAG: transcription-repair coupling factor [Eubacterium sp.]|jgi:transcription-repair coupling factor (superfamily II helicase)|nr:transcription-repair coupling factor [Eubacterium sp.]
MSLFGLIARQLPEYRRLTENFKPGRPLPLSGLSHIHKAHFLAALSAEENLCPFLVLCDAESEAARLCEDINTLALSEVAVLFPEKDLNLGKTVAMSREYEHKRIDALCRVIDNSVKMIVSTPAAAAQMTLSKNALISHMVTIRSGESLSVRSFSDRLLYLGYSRADMIEGQGQFSIRGSIIDVYPVNSRFPIRIELWGDDIDTVSSFSLETQRRIDTIKEIKIPPAVETLFEAEELLKKLIALSDGVFGKYAGAAKKALKTDIDRLSNDLPPMNIDKYLPLSEIGENGLFDFVSLAIVCEQAKCRENLASVIAAFNEEIASCLESGEIVRGIDRYIMSKSEYDAALEKTVCAYFDTFSRTGGYSVNSGGLSPWSGEYKLLVDDLTAYMRKGYAVAVFAGTEKAARTLALDLRDDNLPADYVDRPKKLFLKRIYVLEGSLTGGFEYSEALCACITHTSARIRSSGSNIAAIGNSRSAGGDSKSQKPKKKRRGEEIKSLTDINLGDYVVHSNYGIGVFEGITKLSKENISKDYIKLKYAGTDVLYIPVTQLDMISRYIGNTDTTAIKLNKLNSPQWQKAKTKAKSAATELAEELIELYSARLKSKGHAFAPDGEDMYNFENHFSFIETEDQLRCIGEIKRDMEQDAPMDRLLCGDVGFGKTEVALRAAFKCVMEGKQCALLCPTTVLSWQHFQTTRKRMEGFPLNIELLSRFRTSKEIKSVLEKLEKGIVDMVIGTHRLVQDDVKFKDLGLVIIDEEQRFGVNHKEKLKSAFTGADILTLSATPIPRTLNMAMSGIRDMSAIETPPEDRQPVTTYVIEHDYGVVKTAIEKELRRNGQIYYLHNRIESILSCAAKLGELCPEARIGVAHGKMEENEMLDVWQRLLDREIDILVCTTIIETGIDVPNVNTLVIENADYMGLAQLHQLRGRVGRTNRRAFAYFTFKRGKVLSEIAEKRLNAIREFTQFGSGFRIAMRDLEIRGAGSVLGQRQSGHLSAVGYDMYLKLLNEAVAEKRGEPLKVKQECLIDIKADAYIPESYIGNQAQRISCYKRIAEIETGDDALDVTDELIDRYGEPPKSVYGLIEVAELRNMAQSSGINEITQTGGIINCYTKEPDLVERLKSVMHKMGNRISLNLTERIRISINLLKGEEPLEALKAFLKAYAN